MLYTINLGLSLSTSILLNTQLLKHSKIITQAMEENNFKQTTGENNFKQSLDEDHDFESTPLFSEMHDQVVNRVGSMRTVGNIFGNFFEYLSGFLVMILGGKPKK